MEAVELYGGQKSETLQSANEYASASTVCFRTKVPVFEGKSFNALCRLKAGSFGTISPSLHLEKKIGKVAVSAEGAYLRTRGDYRFRLTDAVEDTVGRRSNGDVESARAELGFWAHPGGGDLQVHSYYYYSERGYPGPVIRRLSDQYATKDRQWDSNASLQASYRKKYRNTAILFNGKGSFDRLEYISDPSMNASSPYIHNTYRQKDLFGSAAIAWYPAQWLSLGAAFDQRWSDLVCNIKYFSYVQRFDTKASACVTITKGGFSLQSSLLGTRIHDVSKQAAEPISKVTPSIAASWHDRGSIFTARAFYKPVFRAPTLNDLYYTFVGNARLDPEYARQLDLGFDFQPLRGGKSVGKLSLDVYANRVTDKIVAMPVGSQFRWSMMNFGRVEGKGLEASWSSALKVQKWKVTCMVAYSYEEARDRTDPKEISFGGQIPYSPWHSGSAILGIERGAWKLYASWLGTGARYSSADNTFSSRLAPWQETDLSLSRNIPLGRGMLEVGIDLNNLLNQQYEVISRYPMPGINFLGKISFKI
jgi:Outer membrane cobalamin receptor protein